MLTKLHSSIQSVQFGKKQYSFINSCTLNSIAQVLLVAVHDNSLIKQTLRSLSEIPIIKLVNYIIDNKGIKTHSYRLRVEILINIVPKGDIQKVFANSYLVKCETDARELTAKLFHLIPSSIETSSCIEGCSSRSVNITTFSIQRSALKDPEFNDAINRYGLLKTHKICPENKTMDI